MLSVVDGNSIADYVDLESYSNLKHELVYGTIIARSGGSLEHARLSMSVGAQLHRQLRGTRCDVFSSDARVHVKNEQLILYPDVSVICGEPETDTEDRMAMVNPVLIVEVTSPSTEGYDRGKKYGYYQSISSLQEYVLVCHEEPLIQVFRRGPVGWAFAAEGETGQIELTSIGCTLDVEETYRRQGAPAF